MIGSMGEWFRHAVRTTWQKRGGSLFVTVIGIVVAVAYHWTRPGVQVTEHLATGVVAIEGALLGILAIFFWNLACAPYRIERKKREDAEAALSVLSPNASGHPDWPVKALFFHIRPDILEHDEGEDQANWNKVERVFLDAASVGRLQVWGRSFDESGMEGLISGNDSGPLQPIPAEYWRGVTLSHNFYSEEVPTKSAHTYPKLRATGFVPMCDLQVSRAQAEAIWPGPDPNSRITVTVDLSGLGVSKVHRNTMRGIAKVSVDDGDKSRLEIFFHAPLRFQYIITADGNETVFLSVKETKPESAVFTIRGPTTQTFLAAIKVTLQETKFAR